MQINYITYGESPLSPLVQTQVIKLLQVIAKETNYEISWIALVSPSDTLLRRQEIRQLAIELEKDGIKLKNFTLPILYSQWFLPRIWLLPIILLITGIILRIHFWNNKQKIILHGRGYLATLLCVYAKRFTRGGVLFDPRSLFPEENVTAGNWHKDSLNYKAWKHLETFLVKNVEFVVGVSNGFSRIIKKESDWQPCFEVIPCMVDVKNFDRNLTDPGHLLSELGLNTTGLVFVYNGSLGRWNSPEMIARYFFYAWQTNKNNRLLIVTKGRTDRLKEILYEYGIPKYVYKFISTAPNEVWKYLAVADIGLQVMEPALDAETRLGVKFAEYLAAGIPVIANSNAGATVSYIEMYQVGAVIDSPEIEIQELFSKPEMFQENVKEKCKILAYKEFDIAPIASMYMDVYQRMFDNL